MYPPKSEDACVNIDPNALYQWLVLIGAVAVGGWRLYRLWSRFEDNEKRTAEIWRFLCQRGMVRAKISGELDMTATAHVDRISDRVREAFARNDFSSELRAWYRREMRTSGWESDEDKLKMKMQMAFGQRLADTVCLDLGVDAGECLVYALAIAREDHGSRQRRAGNDRSEVEDV